MTAIPLTSNRNTPASVLLLLVLVIGAFFLALASVHAVITHGQSAIDAQRCFSGGGTVMTQMMINPLNGRVMEFCRDHGGRWFIKIDGCDGGNVTCFPRSLAKSLRDCLDYAKRTGFTFEVPLIP